MGLNVKPIEVIMTEWKVVDSSFGELTITDPSVEKYVFNTSQKHMTHHIRSLISSLVEPTVCKYHGKYFVNCSQCADDELMDNNATGLSVPFFK